MFITLILINKLFELCTKHNQIHHLFQHRIQFQAMNQFKLNGKQILNLQLCLKTAVFIMVISKLKSKDKENK